MYTFEVERKIGGISFMKDEDRIQAISFNDAEMKLRNGIMTSRFDKSCRIFGMIVSEISETTNSRVDYDLIIVN